MAEEESECKSAQKAKKNVLNTSRSLNLNKVTNLNVHSSDQNTLCLIKNVPLSFAVTLTNTDRFSKFFHWYIVWKICNNAIIKYATTP